jgi:hypothetical protein
LKLFSQELGKSLGCHANTFTQLDKFLGGWYLLIGALKHHREIKNNQKGVLMRLIGAHMDASEVAALDVIAQAHRVPRAAVIRWAILHYLRDTGGPMAGANSPNNSSDQTIHSPDRPTDR